MNHKTLRIFFLLTLFLPSLVSAKSPAGDFLKNLSPSPEFRSHWEVTGAISMGIAKGNADNFNYGLQVLASYLKEYNEGYVGADFFYASDRGSATTNNLRIFTQYNHFISDRFFVGNFTTFFNDEIADLSYRLDAGFTLGYYFIKNNSTKLSIEGGPGYTWEEQGGNRASYPSFRFAQRFEHKFSKEMKIWQSAVMSPEASDFANSLFVAEAGLELLLTEEWSLRTTFRYIYDSTPAGGRGKHDTILLTGLSYSLGGFPEWVDPGRMTLKPEDDEPEEIKMGWTTTAAMNVSLAKGNSDNLFLGTQINSAHRNKAHETFMALSYAFSQNRGDTTADSLRTSIQHNRFIGDQYFIGSNFAYFRDDISNVEYRANPGAVFGYYFRKSDDLTLSIEAGPGIIFEKVGGLSDHFLAMTAAQRFTWEINNRLTLSQNITAMMAPDDSENYLIAANLVLDTDITPNLALRIAASWTFDNTPAIARKESDALLTTGLAIKF